MKPIIYLSIIIFGVLGVAGPPAWAADSNIDETYRWAWSENIGWISFRGQVTASFGDELKGYFNNSSIGLISLNCDSTGNPDGIDVCASSNYKVTKDASNVLWGWAWNDAVGWISFNSDNPGDPSPDGTFNVYIDGSNDFRGYAWSEVLGWISFNCLDPGVCGTSDYKVWMDGDGTIDGYAWNDLVAWLDAAAWFESFGGQSYGVYVDPGNGKFSGYAWSENIGWISFNESDTGSPPSDDPCADATCIAKATAPGQLGKSDVPVYGWARALAYGDGWDGWIRFDHGQTDEVYIDISGDFHGWAWGSDVVGWVSFNSVDPGAGGTAYKVRLTLPTAANANGPYYTLAGISNPITFDACNSNGFITKYEWDVDDTDGVDDWVDFGAVCSNSYNHTYPVQDPGGDYTVTATLRVTDSGGGTDQDTATVTVRHCGNNLLESWEECDGLDDLACPGECQTDCTCPAVGTSGWKWWEVKP